MGKSSTLINIEAQYNWYIINSNYQSYIYLLLKIISLIIVKLYISEFVILYASYLAYLTSKKKHMLYKSRLALVVAREQIYTYINLCTDEIWHNAMYKHGYALFNNNLVIISIMHNKKQYNYVILKYGIKNKILFESLRKTLHYVLFYSQIKKHNIYTPCATFLVRNYFGNIQSIT